ncbi:MAG TPA: hypothetical protein VKG92_11800 [Flavobacteriales bacterium]|nr:hypothetical protein [Flavobacteriales bacterium]
MTNSTLRKRTTRRARKAMPIDLQLGPRAASIQLILGYSRALQVVDAPPVGQVDLILN